MRMLGCAVLAAVIIALPPLAHPQQADTAASPELWAGSIDMARATPQRQAAEQALRTLASRPLVNTTRRSGSRVLDIDDVRALRDATIGYGFEVHVVDPKRLLAGDTIDASLIRSGVWRFAILLADKPIGLMTVARIDGRWRMAEVGAAALAKDIADVVDGYAGDRPAPHMRFIRSPQAVADFIEIIPAPTRESASGPGYVPLLTASEIIDPAAASAPAATTTKRAGRTEREIIEALRTNIRRGMWEPRFNRQEPTP